MFQFIRHFGNIQKKRHTKHAEAMFDNVLHDLALLDIAKQTNECTVHGE